MQQQTLAIAADDNAQYERYRRLTKRDTFLATVEPIVPCATLCEVIEPHSPKAGKGRAPVGLQRMARRCLFQHCFNLADAACDDALLPTARRCAALWASTWAASESPSRPRPGF